MGALMKKNTTVTWLRVFIIFFLIPTLIHANAEPGLSMTIKEPYTITTSAGPHGTIAPVNAQKVNPGATLQFIATPAAGYKVSYWLVDGTIAQTSGIHFLLPNITANHTVQVTFSNTLSILYAGAENAILIAAPAPAPRLDTVCLNELP